MRGKLCETVVRSGTACAILAGLYITESTAEAKSAATPFLLPIQAGCVSSPFGVRHLGSHPQLPSFHNGIDLPAPVGSPVLAVGAGTVVRIQRKGLGGLEALIQHNGFIGVYSHLSSVTPAIAEGHRNVYGGEKIGTVGLTGMTFGPHLFFAMFVGDQPVDPAEILGIAACGRNVKLTHPVLLTPTHVYLAGSAELPMPARALSAR